MRGSAKGAERPGVEFARPFCSAEDLVKAVRKALPVSKWNMPTEDGMEQLRRHIISMQLANALGPMFEDQRARVAEAINHLKGFIKVIEGMASNTQSHVEIIQTIYDRREETREKMIATATEWLGDPMFRTIAVESPDLGDWHTFAYMLAVLFKAAVATANTTEKVARLGHSEQGPVVHFLEGIIPLITGETTATCGAIAQNLKKMEKEFQAGGELAEAVNAELRRFYR